MSDLSELNSTLPVKIAGASSNGTETNFVNSTANGEMKTADFLNAAVLQTVLSVSVAGAAIEVKVGASRLVNRKSVQIQAQGTNVVYGYSSTVQPFTLANGATVTIDIGDTVGVWVDRSSGGGSADVAIAEFA